MARVDLSSAARKDLRKVLKTPAGAAIKRVIVQDLAAERWPENLDVAALAGMGSWVPRTDPQGISVGPTRRVID